MLFIYDEIAQNISPSHSYFDIYQHISTCTHSAQSTHKHMQKVTYWIIY